MLAGHGLSLVSGWYSLRLLERDVDAELDAMAPHFDLLQTLGCTLMVCAEVSGCIHGDFEARLSGRPRMPAAGFRRFVQRLDELAERMGERGMRLAYHHHMGTVIQTEDEVDELMATTSPAVSLLLDTGHLTFARGNPLAAAKRHAGRIAHVHCKDVRPAVVERVRNADTSFLEAVLQGVFTVPGDGSIDYAPIFEVLREAGYAGWLVVEAEQDPAVADPLHYATLGFRTLEQLCHGG
jgi:inosose dehydratase